MMSASRPSRSAGTLTSRGSAPSARTILACASNPPCRARIPTTFGPCAADDAPWLPAARCQQLLGLELGRLEAHHRLAQTSRRSRDPRRVLVVRRRLDDRCGASLGILGLKDPRADEHPL